MKRGLFTTLLFIAGSLLLLYAQERDSIIVVDDAQLEVKAEEIFKDSVPPLRERPPVVVVDKSVPVPQVAPIEFQPNSTKAVIYSAICPGLGQIYNRKYWKLPIVYGGFLGVVYGVTWNGGYYNDYKDAYRDLALRNTANATGGDSWKDFYPTLDPDADGANTQRIIENLRRKKDFYRRYRDLAILVGVGLYALCVIDAYVDAELYDFNMSQDLSMTIAPMILPPTPTSKMSFGLQCTIRF